MTDTEKAALERRIDELCQEVEQLKAENAKLVYVLHEVETEAIYAYQCLQQDCVTTANSSEHFFKKWWHAECELDRAKAEKAKLCAEVERLHADQAHWELGNCPSCPNVVSLQEALEQNAKLRELVKGIYINYAADGVAPLGMICEYASRMKELGVEL